jgi:predicted DNA-binding transcriptional regulator AlpA
MDLSPLRELPERWRSDAEVLRRCGHERTADLCDRHAQELERAVQAHEMELITIGEAAAESGYSKSHLYTLLSEGSLSNAGTKGAPRVMRRDLPKKARPTNGGGFAKRLTARQTQE